MSVSQGSLKRRRAHVFAPLVLSLLFVSLALGLAARAQSLAAQPPSMSMARSGHTATLLPDGRVLVAGGSSYITTSEIYDPAQNEWTAGGNMSVARAGHTATLLPNGQVLVVGGAFSSRSMQAELYDPATGRWRLGGEPKISRLGHTATLLKTGDVLVAGGDTGYAVTMAELYTPATSQWRDTGNMSSVRVRHSATLLPDGRVLVVGGSIAGIAEAEVYDPTGGEWSSAAAMQERHENHVATLLQDGRVLITGASPFVSGPYPGPIGPTVPGSTEIYSSTNNTWTSGPTMLVARWSHSATLLADGRVLVAGGYNWSGQHLSSVEIFDPASNSWHAARPLASGRAGHTATLLADGTLLFVGGYGGAGVLGSAERYDPSDAILGNQRYVPWFIYSANPTPPIFQPTAAPVFPTPTPSF